MLVPGLRWMTMLFLGCLVLACAGLGLIAFHAFRLASDWRRMKPRHNVDLAFVQIILGVILIAVAWYLGRDSVR